MHRAIMVQLGFYFHMQQALGGSRIALTWPLLFAVCFMLVFSIVIALFKDIPDVKGDSQVRLRPFSKLYATTTVPLLYDAPVHFVYASPRCPIHLHSLYKASAECHLLQMCSSSIHLMFAYISMCAVLPSVFDVHCVRALA